MCLTRLEEWVEGNKVAISDVVNVDQGIVGDDHLLVGAKEDGVDASDREDKVGKLVSQAVVYI